VQVDSDSGQVQASKKPIWRRFWIPIAIVIMAGAFELLNLTTNITAEKIMPLFATSAKFVLGRLVFFLASGLILFWLLVTKQVTWKRKGAIYGVVGFIVAAVAGAISKIENTGDNRLVVHFRWEKNQDQRLAEFQPALAPSPEVFQLDPNAPQFTDFLGTKRDGVVAGPKINSDLATNPPEEVWRRPMGQGYASCVISGGLAVTIEQRGDQETVVALDMATGKDRWVRGYVEHFKEKLGGDGPRATPTISGNEVFALGAGGLLVALDLATGNEKWQRNVLEDASAKNITWGMSGAPLVTSDKVIVNPGGKEGAGIIAYNRATGERVWSCGKTQAGYSSPVLAELHGVEQVLVFDAEGVAGYELTTGAELWRFEFKTFNGINVCQPIVLPNNQVLVAAGYDSGAVLMQIEYADSKWSTDFVWKNKSIKSKMGSCIFHNGFIFGLDDGILTCVEAATGKRKWKGGRYGHGQFLLQNDLLIIQAESGELVLVAADSSKHQELAKISMLTGGKTWNAPALAGNLLLLRNHFEAVLLRLATK
jgi:outer membrane protein assembly factor BamB